MHKLIIKDLEVCYRVGVPEEERAAPQRLLVTLELQFDFTKAIATDDLQDTINYAAIAEDLARFGESKTWRLIEKLAADIATFVILKYRPTSAVVTVKKFVLPNTRYVAVTVRSE
jgi:7,8-dihydroneopterin aldolase/epimerase/oxygenase